MNKLVIILPLLTILLGCQTNYDTVYDGHSNHFGSREYYLADVQRDSIGVATYSHADTVHKEVSTLLKDHPIDEISILSYKGQMIIGLKVISYGQEQEATIEKLLQRKLERYGREFKVAIDPLDYERVILFNTDGGIEKKKQWEEIFSEL